MSTFYLGRYNCLEPMGSGALGETFRAKIYGVAGFEKQLAVKRVHAELCADPKFIERFVKAASAAALLGHERIAAIHEVGAQGAIYYVAADLMRGLDLGQLTSALRERGEAITPDAAVTLTLDVLEGLAHAHGRKEAPPHGVLYLGLSPRSMVLTPEGDAKLTDVGLFPPLVTPGWATDARAARLAWVAPEVADGAAADGRADVFSVGALLHLALSGTAPFAAESAAEVRKRQSAGPPPPPACEGRLQAAISRALQPNPALRFPSVEAFADELRPILSTRAGRARGDLAMLVRRISARIAPPQAPDPVLQDEPTKNTFAGVGPADGVPVQKADLPGPATEKSMDAVLPLTNDLPVLPALEPASMKLAAPPPPKPIAPPKPVEPALPAPVEPAISTPVELAPLQLVEPVDPPLTKPPERPPVEPLQQPILPVLPRTEQVPSLPEPPPRSKRGVLLVAGLVVFALSAGAAWLAFGTRGGPPAPAKLPIQSPAPMVTQRELPRPSPSPSPSPSPANANANANANESKLQITTTPPGALIFIDGEPRGQSPLKLSVPAGAHKLVAVSEHAKIRKQELHVDGTTEIALPMEPAETSGPAGLKVRCKSKNELRIFVDGVDSGLSCPNETRINVTPGEHTVGLYSPRTDKTEEVKATVGPDENHSTRIRVNY